MSQLLAFCCCGDEPGGCPVPPCPTCAVDSLVMEVTAGGSITIDGEAHTWTLTPRSTAIVSYPDQVTGVCAWATRTQDGSYDLVVAGPSALAGEYVLTGREFTVVLRCIDGTPLPRSRFQLNADSVFLGADRPRVGVVATGPYVQCAQGFVPELATLEGGLFFDNATLPVSGGDADNLGVVFL